VVEFRMPSLGADMEAGTLVEWLIKPGDPVKRGDIVAVVETQKGAIEIENFEPGTVERILVEIGTKVPVGTPLAIIKTPKEKEGIAPPPPADKPPPAKAPAGPPPQVAADVERVARGARISPAARRLVNQHGIDIVTIKGTGADNAILLTDVERRIAEIKVQAPRAAGFDLGAMREAIAAAMARSKGEIPHYYLAHEIELSACVDWLSRRNAGRPPEERLLLGALLIKAVALAARKFPTFNGFYRNGKFEAAPTVHIGAAIAIRGGGLIAPAIHDVDRLSLDDLMMKMRELIERVRAGRIRSSEIADPTITVSSLGERGVETLYGIIYPPQVAIIGFGKAATRPWVESGTVVARPLVNATLAADHRVSDGHAGALFLAKIDRLLQEPGTL
jgi:pyruvate dehydrogenase E2 component (dihydrolipoyllysine-residue acetyltransferase)